MTHCFILFFLTFFFAGMQPVSAAPLSVEAVPIEPDPDDLGRTRFGGLTFLGGFDLSSKDSRFGGLSGLELSADGNSLYAVSDHGYWLSTRLRHNAEGRLISVGPWEMAPLLTPEGREVRSELRDAEALARDRDGSFIVAFERAHRLWRYPPPSNGFSSPPKPLPTPTELQKAPGNGGLEAVTVLPDRRLLALTERYENADRSLKGWLIENDRFVPLSYLWSDGFRPTGLATLASGDVLLLERRYNWFEGLVVRVRRFSRASLRAGARLQGKEVSVLGPALEVDNFEGLAVREDPKAGTLLYMISDDNYGMFQRTLLLQFRLISP